MRPIRIHLGPMPTMLSAIVGDLLRREPDMLVCGADGGVDPLKTARDQGADVLITQDGASAAGSSLETILQGSGLGICALSPDGQSASAVSLVRRPVALDDGGGFALADAIRRIAETVSADLATAELLEGGARSRGDGR